MITGAHAIIYSKKSDADKAFLKDILGLGHVDVGGGWLLFGLPPSELAIHPGSKNGVHELYLMCEDVNAFRSLLDTKKIKSSAVKDQGWGLLTSVTLPGGGKLGVYEPRHARPGMEAKAPAKSAAKPKKPAASPAKKASPKQAAPAKTSKKAAPKANGKSEAKANGKSEAKANGKKPAASPQSTKKPVPAAKPAKKAVSARP
jgi:hypothetical protein